MLTFCSASQHLTQNKASVPCHLLASSSKPGSPQDSISFIPTPSKNGHPRPLLLLTLPSVLRYSIHSSTCPFPAQNPPCANSAVSTLVLPSEDCTQPTVSSRNTEPVTGWLSSCFHLLAYLCADLLPKAPSTGPQLWAALGPGSQERTKPDKPLSWEVYNTIRKAVFVYVILKR